VETWRHGRDRKDAAVRSRARRARTWNLRRGEEPRRVLGLYGGGVAARARARAVVPLPGAIDRGTV
jgi:hypothetical protein